MSHFTVLVIGPDPEKQLAPYHEFECTGKNDEFVKDIDETQEQRRKFKKYLAEKTDEPKKYGPKDFAKWLSGWCGIPHTKPGGKPDIENEHKYGYALLDARGKVAKVVDRTNPNAKWDWYSLGGRWAGFFKLKSGIKMYITGDPSLVCENKAKPGWADQVLKGDIDFAGMFAEHAKEAGEAWDKIYKIAPDLRKIKPFSHFEKKYENIEKAREEYRNQKPLKQLQDAEMFIWSPENFMVSREEYVSRVTPSRCRTFAVVKDGKWYARGEMGWWALVISDKKENEWESEYDKLLNSIPGDTLLSVYDCHT